MEPMLDEIRATYDCGIWSPVISSILMLPDVCGAVEFWGQNKRPRDRYIDWYNQWALPQFISPTVTFDGDVVYIVRNAMIHESTGFTRGKHGFDRIVFMPPNRRNVTMEFCLSRNNGGIKEAAFQVTILGFMEAVDRAVRNWLAEVRADPDKRRESAIDKLIQYRPLGQSPHFVGIPVIS
jgi:hypothetical protein